MARVYLGPGAISLPKGVKCAPKSWAKARVASRKVPGVEGFWACRGALFGTEKCGIRAPGLLLLAAPRAVLPVLAGFYQMIFNMCHYFLAKTTPGLVPYSG